MLNWVCGCWCDKNRTNRAERNRPTGRAVNEAESRMFLSVGREHNATAATKERGKEILPQSHPKGPRSGVCEADGKGRQRERASVCVEDRADKRQAQGHDPAEQKQQRKRGRRKRGRRKRRTRAYCDAVKRERRERERRSRRVMRWLSKSDDQPERESARKGMK